MILFQLFEKKSNLNYFFWNNLVLTTKINGLYFFLKIKLQKKDHGKEKNETDINYKKLEKRLCQEMLGDNDFEFLQLKHPLTKPFLAFLCSLFYCHSVFLLSNTVLGKESWSYLTVFHAT